ncbi:MAG: YedE family putative selenium transporter [Eubacteriales bacterium]|nr:YedE family putative selenium transporter [Eubacteriales bacterium]
MKRTVKLAIIGLILGVISVVAVYFGNPGNMGFCLACFVRDTAGSFHLHQAVPVRYLRPEIFGLLIGAFLMAKGKGEFSPRGGSSPLTRFVLGFCVMTGALIFLGCPFRMLLRMAGGDLNAWVGLLGFVTGIFAGTLFLKRGFSLKRSYKTGTLEGSILPVIAVGVMLTAIIAPTLFAVSEKGPGAMHAPIWYALGAGLIVGALAQRNRFCMIGGIRDMILFRHAELLTGSIGVLVAAWVANMAFGFFHFGFANQPIAHTDGIWNFAGLFLVGLASTLAGGCPLRQFIMSGEGNTDAAITILGLFFGAAFAHNFGWAASPNGVPVAGKIATGIAIFVVLLIGFFNRGKEV